MLEGEDETQKNSKIRELRFIKYFNKDTDKQLHVLNKQDDESQFCLTESLSRSLSRRRQNSQILQEDFSEIEQERVKLQEIQYQSKQIGVFNIEQNENILKPKPFSNSLFSKNEYPLKIEQKQQSRQNKYNQNNESIIQREQEKKLSKIEYKSQNEDEEKQSNTLHTFRDFKTQITNKKKQSGELKNNIMKIDIKIISFLKLRLQRFISKFTVSGRTRLLNSKIRQEIHDLSDIFYFYDKNYTFKFAYIPFKILSKISVLKQIPQIDLQTKKGFIIKLLLALFNCVFLYFFSLILIFQGFQQHLKRINIVVKLIWFIEIILKFNTSSHFNQDKLRTRAQSISHYLKNYFIFDLLPIITMKETESKSLPDVFIQLLVFSKLWNILQDWNYIQKRICMIIKTYQIVQLVNLIIKLFLFAHIIATAWYILGLVEQQIFNQVTWFNDGTVHLDSYWWQYYVWSIYWALTLMTTGSNVATSVFQALFTSIIMLFTTIVFGYSLNVIGIILSDNDETQRQKRKDVNILNEFMRNRNISSQGNLLNSILQKQIPNSNFDPYLHLNYKIQFVIVQQLCIYLLQINSILKLYYFPQVNE